MSRLDGTTAYRRRRPSRTASARSPRSGSRAFRSPPRATPHDGRNHPRLPSRAPRLPHVWGGAAVAHPHVLAGGGAARRTTTTGDAVMDTDKVIAMCVSSAITLSLAALVFGAVRGCETT